MNWTNFLRAGSNRVRTSFWTNSDRRGVCLRGVNNATSTEKNETRRVTRTRTEGAAMQWGNGDETTKLFNLNWMNYYLARHLADGPAWSENNRRTIGEQPENNRRTIGLHFDTQSAISENNRRTIEIRENPQSAISENNRRTFEISENPQSTTFEFKIRIGEQSENNRRTIGEQSENNRRTIGEHLN